MDSFKANISFFITFTDTTMEWEGWTDLKTLKYEIEY